MRVALIIICLVCFAAVGRGQPVNDQITKAWQERHDKVRTAEFHITAKTHWSKEGFALEEQAGYGPRPKEDVHTECRYAYILDGTKVRAESDGVQWSGEDFRQFRRITLLDGKLKTEFDEGRDPTPRGFIAHESDYFEVKFASFLPLTRCFRGVSRLMRSFLIDDLKPTGTKLVIGGRTCEQFVLKRVGGDRTEFWLDPGRDWIIVREAYINPKQTHTQIDITYEPNTICGWVPTSWESRQTKLDTISMSSARFTVSKYTLNETIPESTFTLTFPAGTTVRDVRDVHNKKEYVVTSETVQTLTTEAGSRPWWHYAIAAALAAGLVGALVYLARRRKRSSFVSVSGEAQ
ncbi:MAG: hypothetical protein L0241_23580 [Planctomycetia bacterium]|nr:hypothetical protein [Planctomycetia bacterium]